MASKDQREYLHHEQGTKDLLLELFLFAHDIPWMTEDFQPSLVCRFRHCVRKAFWNTDATWRHATSPVLKRRGAVYLFELGKAKKRALMWCIANRYTITEGYEAVADELFSETYKFTTKDRTVATRRLV